MAAVNLDLYVEQAAGLDYVFTFKDEMSAKIDMTGKTLRGQIRKSIGGTLVMEFDIHVLNQSTNLGEVRVALAASTTAAVKVPRQTSANRQSLRFVYDILDVSAGIRLAQGGLEFSPSVTV